MQSREAYDAICAAITASPSKQIINLQFNEEHFGSFAIAFEDEREPKCIVNDRGFLIVTQRLDGTGEAILTVPSLGDEDAASLLQTLKL